MYGPLSGTCGSATDGFAATVDLSTVGLSTPGIVFHGEIAGDGAGKTVSRWQEIGGADDLLIGAPDATVLDETGMPMAAAGAIFAIHGGVSNLDDKAVAGVIDLSRVANNAGDQVNGTVFVGTEPGERIGRSMTGEVDVDGDGTPDVIYGTEGKVWTIPGADPKTSSTLSRSGGPKKDQGIQALLDSDGDNFVDQFGGVLFTLPVGDVGELEVGPAGDLNDDGVEDFIIGAPRADPSGKTDAGRAYVVYGTKAPRGEVKTTRRGISPSTSTMRSSAS